MRIRYFLFTLSTLFNQVQADLEHGNTGCSDIFVSFYDLNFCMQPFFCDVALSNLLPASEQLDGLLLD